MTDVPDGLIYQNGSFDIWNEDWKNKPVSEWTIQDNACFEFQAMCQYHDDNMEENGEG
jgi:hypothetical protein